MTSKEAPKTTPTNGVLDVPIVFVSNTYFDDQLAEKRTARIPWEALQRAGMLSQEKCELVKRVDKQARDHIDEAMDKNGEQYAELYTEILEKALRVDTLQYIFVLIADMLADNEQRAEYFLNLSNNDKQLPYRPFLKHLKSQDEFVELASAKILTLLVCFPKPLPFDIGEFFTWIAPKVKSNNVQVCDLTVQFLESVLRVPNYRVPFWETTQAVNSLVDVLMTKNPSHQMQYQIIFCFWMLTFEAKVAAEFNKHELIPTMINIAKHAIKEKVIRVVIGTFRNLVEKAPEANLPAMLVAKLLNFLENLSGRKLNDNEIVEDILFLKTELQANFHSLTTFDEYASEIRSGMLQWSPAHESEQFWKHNAQRLNDNDHELLRILARLLSSNDNLVMAVAAHDVGQYVKNYANGKKFLQSIGAKQRIMELMTHEDQDVRYQALIAVQKYMTNAWEF